MSRLGSARADSLRPVLGGVVLLFAVLLGAAGLKSWRDLNAAQAREKQLETRIETARAGIDHLRGRIELLRSDPGMLERLAREDLGLVEPRDVVIELPRSDRGAAPQPDAAPLHLSQSPPAVSAALGVALPGGSAAPSPTAPPSAVPPPGGPLPAVPPSDGPPSTVPAHAAAAPVPAPRQSAAVAPAPALPMGRGIPTAPAVAPARAAPSPALAPLPSAGAASSSPPPGAA